VSLIALYWNVPSPASQISTIAVASATVFVIVVRGLTNGTPVKKDEISIPVLDASIVSVRNL
jgi:hypothetical protein